MKNLKVNGTSVSLDDTVEYFFYRYGMSNKYIKTES